MLRYVCNQVLWIISVSAQLLAAMGLGVKWMTMTARLVTFSLLNLWYFIPHLWWYLVSPNIIRCVSYRASGRRRRRELKLLSKKTSRVSSVKCNGKKESGNATGSVISQGLPEDQDVVQLMTSSLNSTEAPMKKELSQRINNARVGIVGDTLRERNVDLFTDPLMHIQPYDISVRTKEDAGGENNNAGWASVSPAENISTGESGEDEEEEDEEEMMNLHNRAMLDIYLPVPIDSLFHMIEDNNQMSTQSKSKSSRRKFPVVIFVMGGAWIVGFRFWNFLVARLFAARGYIVFCPDYRNFPQTNMEGMVLDVSDAISWVIQNAERYGGDLKNITLVGQSAGAHLTMMSILSQAQIHAHTVSGGPPPSNVAYNVPKYNPRQYIRRYIGLSGIYNVRKLVRHFHSRGLYRGVLYQLAGGRANLSRYSLNLYFDKRRCGDTGEVLAKNLFDFLPQQMFFIHGDADCSAPVSESANIAFVMRSAQRMWLAEEVTVNERNSRGTQLPPVVIEYIVVPGATHTDAIVEECLCAHTSHVIDFLCHYDTSDTSRKLDLDNHKIFQSKRVTFEGTGNGENDGINILKCPDETLFTPAPHHMRPLLVRLASCVCPF